MTGCRRTMNTMSVTCLLMLTPLWAGVQPPLQTGALQFFGNATSIGGQGTLDFNPGVANQLTIGPSSGGNGALITDLFNSVIPPLCGGDCAVIGGYLTLTSGGQFSGGCSSGSCMYDFGPGGQVDIFGEIPVLGINNPSLLFQSTFTDGTFTVAGITGTFTGDLNVASIFLNSGIGTFTFANGSTAETSMNLNANCSLGGVCTGLVDPVLQLQTVPEPGTLSLIGTGMLVFGPISLRRRFTR
jgi:hypothetical protein